MTDDELSVLVANQEHHASTVAHSQLAQERANALKLYLGEKFGNEVEGRSQVISTDVFEAIEGMLPSLLEIFLSSNRLGECEPFGIEDEEEARQQTDVANHIILKQNNAALLFYTWFKDALIQKVGIVKTYYETEDQVRMERYAGLTDEEMTRLLGNNEDIEVTERVQREIQIMSPEGPVTIPVNDITVKVHVNRQKVVTKNVPPENFLVTSRQQSLDLSECEFCSHKERKTATDLMEMGVEKEFLEECGDDDSGVETSEERIARDIYKDTYNRDVSHEDPSLKEFWCSDAYIQVDTNDDGIAELRHVIKIGNKIWLNEETDIIPFSVICPILLPHQFYGLSVADITADVQVVKSALWRQMMDNLYLTNNPRTAVVQNQVNMDDLLTARPGGVVRMNAPGMATPMVIPFVAKESFPMLEYWDAVKETRTGVTRYNQGLDADSLNKTAHGISAILGQSMKRLEMIARIFAETGVKDLFKQVLHCVAKSGMKQMIIKMTNGYVSVDPREWKNQHNITINVGIGTGNKDRVIQMLSMIGGKQLELKQTGRGYMISEMNDYSLAAKLAEAAGFKNPELFFTDPTMVPPEAKQPPPDPEMIKLQADMQYKQADMQATTQAKQADMMNERTIEEMKAQIKAQTDIAVANIQKEKDIAVAEIKADTEKRTKMADVTMKEHEMRQEAELAVFDSQQERTGKKESQSQSPLTLDIGGVAGESMTKAMSESMQTIMQALAQSNQQTAEALQALAQATDRIGQIMMAPRKRIKDKSGKTVGMEVQGFGNVTVQ